VSRKPGQLHIITKTETHVIDGLTYEFLLAPETEAPSEMVFSIKEMKLVNTAELAAHTLHNTYSPRGTKIRNPLAWSKALNQTIDMWGDEVEVQISQHHWPVWGNAQVVEHLSLQRDMYRYINDETLRPANHGHTMVEIAEKVEPPNTIGKKFSNRGYYGTFNHNVKATYVLYLGWFDGNPATLHELPPTEASKRYVEMLGGIDSLLEKAQTYFDKGDYRWVAQVINHAVFADPTSKPARDLQANALEQLGYQAEAGDWRNFYLTGAKELREGVKQLPSVDTASPDTIAAMGLDLFFDYLGVRLNGPNAAGKRIVLNFDFTDVNQKYTIEMVNGVLNNTADRHADDADASIEVSRATLNQIVLGQTDLDKAISAGDVTIDGSQDKLKELLSYLDDFKLWFNIVTP
jgi:alkyl sulfatase BDS1-like metallo-beta-lactamase superfamily hydrolase